MGGGPALPTPSTPGYTAYKDYYGRTWTACYCLAQWLKVYQRLLLAHGEIKQCIDIWQLTGGAADSAGTHTQGGVFDLLFPLSDKAVALGREMGAPPLWRRPAPPFKKPHLHGVLNGCAHNDPARYQIAAQKAGYDGLGEDGRLHKDPHPDPKVYRTWREGIAWAEAQIKKLQPPTPVIVPEEDIMADISDLRTVVRDELRDPEYLREVARFVLTGYQFDHDGSPDTPEAVLAYAERATLQEATLSDADVERIASAVAALLPKAAGA